MSIYITLDFSILHYPNINRTDIITIMKLKHQFSTILFSLFIVFSTNVIAQITIGSNIEPINGALLDLKTQTPNEQNVTSDKGLGIPRVQLVATNSLKPAVPNHTEGEPDDAHIGLMLYNTNMCIDKGSGLYVWAGEQWEKMGNVDYGTDYTDFDASTEILTDFEGNKYPTKMFNGKRWMTKNLRSLRKSDGRPIACGDSLRFNPGYYTIPEGVVVKISVPDGTIGALLEAGVEIPAGTRTYSQWLDIYGLMYNNEQATEACPRGWHLASEDDWNNLFDYMKSIDATNYGHVMKANTNTLYKGVANVATTNWSNGTVVQESGFNILPSGYIRYNISTNDFEANSYGTYTYFWLGTSKYLTLSYSRSTPSIFPVGSNLKHGFSVRCVQNE